ncbi:acyl-CoA dehydrogenase [Gammaproteobacteria bacterium]|nr:acyl-CoA dehydrogenase [Gammaproteobacteria bacterium]
MVFAWILAFVVCFFTLSYQRSSLNVWALGLVVFFILLTKLSNLETSALVAVWLIFIAILSFLYANTFRKKIFTKKILTFYKKNMPTMSNTEKEALSAGTVAWEKDLFCGDPDWNKLLQLKKPEITQEEKEFLEGPVESLCSSINDWEISHKLADLPSSMWQFLKDKKFFGLQISKKYGGLGFSAYAQSQILIKVYGKSAAVGTTIAVPNSLGPGELLFHYGTDKQKDYYLPRLADGVEVPCFALTGVEAGSDAGSMSDKGIVEWGEFQGEKVLGIRLNFNKRYITLAPVATVIGLAFKLYDPSMLIGKTKNIGITCALIPRDTNGVTIGRRHLPCDISFQNGPIIGKNVFIPLDYIIGGVDMVGHGWRMLMECLAAGRGVTLPASAVGGSKVAVYTSGAYARIRRQFKVSIGSFEGVEEALARIAGFAYIMDATRSLTAAMINAGEKPALASAITKYHVTEFGRIVGNDAMDIHGGKGIMLGSKNYLARNYQSIPIAITVEGANILTRSMIIFGQGAMRCHPYIYAELEAANLNDKCQSLNNFDKALMGHIYYLFTNFIRTFVLGLTGAKLINFSKKSHKRYFQQASRFSAAFAMLSDVSLLILGGSLKRKEKISARLGDILSYLFMFSAVFKHYYNLGENKEDLSLVRWSALYCLYTIQQKFDELLKNFPNKWLGSFLRFIIFPLGMHFSLPSDKLGHKVANLILDRTATRERLSDGVFDTNVSSNVCASIEDALIKTISAEKIEKKVRILFKQKMLQSTILKDQVKEAFDKNLISESECETYFVALEARLSIISVDDFAPGEFVR